MTRVKKTTSKIISWIFGSIIVIMLAFEAYGFISALSNHGVPNFFGYQMLVIETDSMDRGPDTYPVDMGIIVKKVDPSTLVASTSFEQFDGDIITFYRISDRRVVTHRIIGITETETGRQFQCLGDNLFADTCPQTGCTISNSDMVAESDVLGKVINKSLTLGKTYRFLSHPATMLLLVLIPLGILVVLSSMDFIKALKTKEATPAVQLTAADIQEIKEEARKALLEELRAKQKGEQPPHEK